MEIPKGKLFAIGGAEDKGVDLEKGKIVRNNLNFFELGSPGGCEEAGEKTVV